MSDLWTAAEVAAATAGKAAGAWTARGVSIDSRSIAAGDLFIALAGPKFDGHDFVAAALARGAAAAVVARRPPDVAADAPLAMVADTMEALTALGRAARARTAAHVVGVTGSVGKTGTKEALRHALAGQGETAASVGSFNNHWGVPLSLARMPRDARFAVLEMGMNHPGELTVLSRLARPHVALITTVEPAHLGFFASEEAIADAKAEIFDGAESGGTAVLNRDNRHFARLEQQARRRGLAIRSFGADPAADIRLLDCEIEAESSRVSAAMNGRRLAYTVSLPGRHWVQNSLAVLAAVQALGGDIDSAAQALAALPPLAGRGRRHRIRVGAGTATLIDESYNASPAAMRAAFAVLGAAQPGAGGRRIAVLGDMLELGASAPRLHADLRDSLVGAGINLVFTVGCEMRHLHDALPQHLRGGHRSTSTEMAALVVGALRPGDVLTVKGSLGIRMSEIVKRLLADAAEPATPS